MTITKNDLHFIKKVANGYYGVKFLIYSRLI